MARLTIPRGVRKSLVALATVSSEQTEQLIETLSSLSPNLSPEEIPEQLASKLTQWDSDQARETIQAILGLCALRAQTGQKPETLVADVILTLKRDTGLEDSSTDGKAVVVLAPENEERLRNSLLRLFSITVLDVTAKALGVLTDNQRSFVSARILSDMRPIFKDDISAGPMAAVIVHSLKLEFMESHEPREFFVALDSKDLQLILDLIQRALKKDEAIRSQLAKSDIPLLENG